MARPCITRPPGAPCAHTERKRGRQVRPQALGPVPNASQAPAGMYVCTHVRIPPRRRLLRKAHVPLRGARPQAPCTHRLALQDRAAARHTPYTVYVCPIKPQLSPSRHVRMPTCTLYRIRMPDQAPAQPQQACTYAHTYAHMYSAWLGQARVKKILPTRASMLCARPARSSVHISDAISVSSQLCAHLRCDLGELAALCASQMRSR